MDRTRRSPRWLVPGLLSIVGAVLLLALLRWLTAIPPQPPCENGAGLDPARNALSSDECARLFSLKNSAVGLLENDQFTQADAALVELSERLPNDPLGIRNLTISRLLGAQAGIVEIARAETAAEQLSQRDPQSAVTHLLVGRVADAAGKHERAVRELELAAELDPTSAALWYELFLSVRNSTEQQMQARARQAMRRAYDAQPANLFLLVEWLLEQSLAQDVGIQPTLVAARAALAPLVENVRQLTRVDLFELLDVAEAAVSKGDWPAAVQRMRILGNVIKPQPAAQSDLRKVRPNSLEFVLYEFHPGFCGDQLPAAEANEANEAEITVRFVPDGQVFAMSNGKPVESLTLADFDSDGTLDVVAASDSAFEVVSRSGVSSEWRQTLRMDLPAGMPQILLGDLDADIVDTPQPRSTQQPQAATAPAEGTPPGESCYQADLDVIAFGPAGAVVFRNDVDPASVTRLLTPIPQAEDFQALKEIQTAILADFDMDGDLDLIVAAVEGFSLWANRGNLTFQNVSTRSKLPTFSAPATALVAVDWDRDLDLDIVIAGPSIGRAGILENLQHGRFRWVPFGEEFADLKNARTLSLIDVDGNAYWDLLGGGDNGLFLVTTQSPGSGTVKFAKSIKVAAEGVRALQTWDYDNNGRLDVIAQAESKIAVYRGQAGGTFSEIPQLIGQVAESASQVAWETSTVMATRTSSSQLLTGLNCTATREATKTVGSTSGSGRRKSKGERLPQAGGSITMESGASWNFEPA